MEKYLAPVNPSNEKPRPMNRPRWKRSLIELNGSSEPNYRHSMSGLIMHSYSEKIGAFPHTYHVNGVLCPTHVDCFDGNGFNNGPSGQCVSSLEFDSKGVYLASVTKSGCLTVHDFDSINGPDLEEDEAKQLLHISTDKQLDVVRWNLANQDEVACTSLTSSVVDVFDVGYVSSEPVGVLRKRPIFSIHGINLHRGYSDIAFSSNDKSRLLASDNNGAVNVWDRRASNFPCFELTTKYASPINSIKLSGDGEWIVFGASKQGAIYVWDLRGGRSSAAFSNHKEESFSPLCSVKLSRELANIQSLKDQTNIFPTEIHSIDIDPSCPYHLAFHLDDGWSGVLDTNKLQVTHLHCPIPPWDDSDVSVNLSYLRKPCWLPMNSIYVVGSPSHYGLYLLDFYPNCTSACHVDYKFDDIRNDEATSQHSGNRYLSMSQVVSACAAHPLNGTIVAGTQISSLLVISN